MMYWHMKHKERIKRHITWGDSVAPVSSLYPLHTPHYSDYYFCTLLCASHYTYKVLDMQIL